MRLLQAYVFRQLLGPIVLAGLALSGLALLGQSIAALGLIVDQRQSPLVLAQVALLAMPQLVVLILPLAVLIGALVALNRLHTEQEIVICFAAGASRWRVLAPALRLASVVALISLVLSLWIQPLCYRGLRETIHKVRMELASAMIKPGRFIHPAPGLTVFAQSLDDDGVLHNLFIDRQGRHGREITLMAREGRLERRSGAPMLVLRQGADQEISPTGSLNILSFDEYVVDLRPLLAVDPDVRYKPSDRYMRELFFPGPLIGADRRERIRHLSEGHARIATALYNPAFMLLSLCAVIGGPFSRMGYGARIAAAAGVAVAVRTFGFAAQAAAEAAPAWNLLQYLAPAGLAAGSAYALFNPKLWTSGIARSPLAGGGLPLKAAR